PDVPLGTVDRPLNGGKTCGGVMRAAPAGFPSGDPATAFALGADTAALTHGHPTGYLPAGFLAAAVCRLVRGDSMRRSFAVARGELERWAGHQETTAALDAAETLVRRSRGSGDGWPEAAVFESLGAGVGVGVVRRSGHTSI
nr:ADP-ribosylglycohydrolase family protein [Micromonospora sp. DSM 115978]